ncbi:MAG: ankyrin repeat domain-containing protein [Alphaproteobacteria bacterium]|nr:ankyrin repeat domain-containing protein [Alphaproteobacteria bacterium]
MAQPRLILSLLVSVLIAGPALAAQKPAAPSPDAPPSAVAAADFLLVKRKYKEAFGLLLKAAQQGDAPAMVKLGNAYRLGLGTEQNLTEARSWYERAAAAGNENAKAVLARLGVSVAPTEKKAGLKAGESAALPEGSIDYAHLPERPKGQPGWFEIAAAHQDKAALKALAAATPGEAALISARLGDTAGIGATAQGAAAVDGLGRSGVMLALAQDKPEVLAAALATKPDLSIQDKRGLTAAGLAAANCDGAKLAELAKAGADLGAGAAPPAVLAARACADWASLKRVFAGKDLNGVDAQGRSAAWYAAARGDVALLGWLADQGANLALPDKDGFAPLHSAALAGQEMAFRFILSKSVNSAIKTTRNVTPLMLSAASGCVGCIATLLDSKPALDEKDAGGDTALMYAVRALQGGAAQKLADSGANPNAKNLAGDTPIKLGLRLGLTQIKAAE